MQHRALAHSITQPAYRIRPARADVARLAETVRSLAQARARWERLVRHDPAQRGFVRLLDTPEVEAWLLTWTEAQSIELHDHGGSAGAAMVVAGELTEAFTDRVGKTPLRHIVWPSGSTHFFDGNHIHDLQNCGPEPVTSIHVYSPPLTSMTFYDHRPDSYLAPLRSDPLTAATGHAHSPLT
jgi:predicted metal-dependent enzyme (double-stranded beta helix superfamily)